MKSEDYVRFLTEQFVRYMETPREEREKARMEHKAKRPPLRNQLFGQIPNAIESYTAQISEHLKKRKK
ncbi:MAG: YqzE family protein [Sporolactobacillus sp.]|uniref:YqzE family protein n=1 Tax=Sporolactobacillus sp. STSJ-5 TaxID=2965076 RepID=UPI002104E7F9|nr:YqzE family protein [Sporolactobacillus sp. STSJ-5]MCQ2008407.1 YqzE family protein [Sporolactobacillus sp. STSJ-5]